MPALTLNGVTVPVALTSLERPETLGLGAQGRGTSGRMEDARRKRKDLWRGRTTPQAAATARAFRGLLEGLGQSWSFDSTLYSARGLGPSTGTGTITASGKYGSHVKVASTDALGYALGQPGTGDSVRWTCLYWKKAQNGGAWEHFIVLGDGSKYKNGAATTDVPLIAYTGTDLALYSPGYLYAEGTAWEPGGVVETGLFRTSTDGLYLFEVTEEGGGLNYSDEPVWDTSSYGATTADLFDPTLVWTYRGEAPGYFDDVVLLPYLVPSGWVAQLYAEMAARAWTAQPNLRASGDLLNAARTVQGRITDSAAAAFYSSTALDRGAETLAFELLETA